MNFNGVSVNPGADTINYLRRITRIDSYHVLYPINSVVTIFVNISDTGSSTLATEPIATLF